VFDAPDRAFRLFGGACRRGIYDHMSTAVETVFIGKKRQFYRRFLQMCSHYLVEPSELRNCSTASISRSFCVTRLRFPRERSKARVRSRTANESGQRQ
jgi:transposase